MDTRSPTAVVTGAASGIGHALVRALMASGYRATAADIDATALTAAASSTGASAHVMDVTSVEDNDALAAETGAVDLLCLNAGVASQQAAPVWETPPGEWRRVFDVNFYGVVNGLRSFLPALLATGRDHRVLITASLAGLATWPTGGAYAASKHAVITVAEQAALALRGTSVSITVLCPALVRTGMSDVGANPADVAQQALAAVARRSFLVVPEEWRPAVVARGQRLAAGLPPELPTPSAG
jgi:NADP-dependent 3-hydroxy acid dehydrogenase YdfG